MIFAVLRIRQNRRDRNGDIADPLILLFFAFVDLHDLDLATPSIVGRSWVINAQEVTVEAVSGTVLYSFDEAPTQSRCVPQI